jgi:hypothetical protein
MDFPTLELFDVTVSQAVLELNRLLDAHEGRIRVLLGQDDMVRHNLLRILERRGRHAVATPAGDIWQLDVAPGPSISSEVSPLGPRVLSRGPRPLLLLRNTLGEEPLGRRLLLGVLQAIPAELPWLGLALDALSLLADPRAMTVLTELQARGVPVRLSGESLMLSGAEVAPFEVMQDLEWQRLLARGELSVL